MTKDDALRAALEQPQDHVPDARKMVQQPPNPYRSEIDHAHELRRHSRKLGHPVGETAGVMQRAADEIDRLREALEQPQGDQEPVAVIGDVWTLNWVGSDPIATIVKKHGLKIGDKLYTSPQPKREPLTDQVIQELADEGVFHANVFEIVRRIEEEHGIFKLRTHGIGGEV